MLFERIEEKTELHEQLNKCFGSISNAARALGYNKNTVYTWINPDCKIKLSCNKIAAGFASHDEEIAKLKKMLSVD